MPYITQAEAELNVDGFSLKTQAEKDRLLLQSEAFIRSKCVPSYTDPTQVPEAIKQASYEAIRGISGGKLLTGIKQTVTEKRVKADSVEVQKKFADGSIEISAEEQLIDMLIAPFANCNKGGSFVGCLERF